MLCFPDKVEEQAEFTAFAQVFFKNYAPSNEGELQMCNDLVQIQWSQRRYRTMEHLQLELAMSKEGTPTATPTSAALPSPPLPASTS